MFSEEEAGCRVLSHSPYQLQVVFLPSTASVALDSMKSPQGCALIFVPNLLPIFPSLSHTHWCGRPSVGLGHTAAAGAPSQGTQGHPTQCSALPSATGTRPTPTNLLPCNYTIPFQAQNSVCASTVVWLKAVSGTSMEMMLSRVKFSVRKPKVTLNSPGKAQRGIKKILNNPASLCCCVDRYKQATDRRYSAAACPL